MASYDEAVALAIRTVEDAMKGVPEAEVVDTVAAGLGSSTDKDALSLAVRSVMDKGMGAGPSTLLARAGKLLDLSIDLAARDLADPRLPFMLIEDLFDARPTSQCERLFALLEDRAWRLLPVVAASAKTKLVLLRTCNELLRRLSKTKNTNFCGRILMLMAYTLPLSERSGVNVRGMFNVKPLELEEGEGDNEHEGQPPADGAGAQGGASAGARVPGAAPGHACVGASGGAKAAAGTAADDGEFYRTFWGVQEVFQEPRRAVVDETAWRDTVSKLGKILAAFNQSATRDGLDLAAQDAAAPSADDDPAAALRGDALQEAMDAYEAEAARGEREAQAEDSKDNLGSGGDSGHKIYFSKFLTSRRLIGLQMRDSYFRRHILIQVALFCQTVSVPAGKAPALASADQQRQAAQISSEALGILRNTGMVEELLRSELDWIAWKRESCPVFERPPLEDTTPSLDTARKRPTSAPAGGDTEDARPVPGKRKRINMGSQELTRLWNLCGDSLDDLAELAERTSVPTLASYLQPVVQQMDPAEGIEEAFKVANDKVYTWKALRLMHRTDLSLTDTYQKGGLEAVARVISGIAAKEAGAEGDPGAPAGEGEGRKEVGEGEDDEAGDAGGGAAGESAPRLDGDNGDRQFQDMEADADPDQNGEEDRYAQPGRGADGDDDGGVDVAQRGDEGDDAKEDSDEEHDHEGMQVVEE